MASANGHDEFLLKDGEIAASQIGFFALCLALENQFPEATPIGLTGAPSAERFRFRANPTLGFPAEELSRITLGETPDAPIEIVANLMGLHGPSSPLPASFTERIIFAEGDGALRDFSDFFNHRLLALLFRVWKHYKHHYRYETGATDTISSAIAALYGAASTSEALPTRTLLLPYAGLLNLFSHSASLVAGVIRHYFGFACEIEEFVERMIDIPQGDRVAMGQANSELGETMVIGEATRDVTGKFRIRLGPLKAEEFERMLPDGEGFATLRELVNLTIRDPLAWDVAIVLAPGETPAAMLGQSRMGWTSWLDPDPEKPVELQLG